MFVWHQYRPKEYLIIYNDMLEKWKIGSVHTVVIEWESYLRHGTSGLYVSSYEQNGEVCKFSIPFAAFTMPFISIIIL